MYSKIIYLTNPRIVIYPKIYMKSFHFNNFFIAGILIYLNSLKNKKAS